MESPVLLRNDTAKLLSSESESEGDNLCNSLSPKKPKNLVLQIKQVVEKNQ